MASGKDIFYIVQHVEELKSLDKIVIETANEIGRLYSVKMRLEADVKDRMKGIYPYGYVLMDKYMEAIYNDK